MMVLIFIVMRSSNKSSMFKIGFMSAMLMSDTKPIHFERKKTKTPLTNKQKLVRKKNKSARKSRAKNRR